MRAIGLAARIALAAACAVQGASAARTAGDPGRGERVFQYCYSCHSVDPHETATLQGPSLVGIVGRRIAAEPDFEYSPALRAFAEKHGRSSEDLLDHYITEPEKVVPQTTMAFPGIEEAGERAEPPGVPENAGALSLRAVRCARCRKSARKARVGAPAQVQLRPIEARPSSRRSARFGMPRSQSEVESRLASSRSRARRTAAPHSSGSRSPRPI